MLNQPGGVFIPALYPEWEDLPKMAGEDARIWKGGFRIPNTPSRRWSVSVWLNQSLFIRSCITCLLFLQIRGIGFSSPLTLRSCERIMVRDEPTPLMLWLCPNCVFLWLNKRLSQSMLDMFLSSDLPYNTQSSCYRPSVFARKSPSLRRIDVLGSSLIPT